MRPISVFAVALLFGASSLQANPRPSSSTEELKIRSLDHLTAYCFWINNHIHMRLKNGLMRSNKIIDPTEVDSDANYFIKLHNRHVLNTAETRRVHREVQQVIDAMLEDSMQADGHNMVNTTLELEHLGCSLERVSIQDVGGHRFSEEAKKLRR